MAHSEALIRQVEDIGVFRPDEIVPASARDQNEPEDW